MTGAGTDAQVLVSRAGATATVSLNRPGSNNALDAAVKEQLLDALEALAQDSTVRAVILTGTGRAFCVGQDLDEHGEALRVDARASVDSIREYYNPIVTTLSTMPKPVVAAINGTCVGAALGFALACDVRIAADTAKFGTAFSAIGLTCDSGLSAALVGAVGGARASELVLLGEPFTAEQALEWGIVGQVVPSHELRATADKLADRLAAGPTAAYAESKRLLAAARRPTLAEVLAAEHSAQTRLAQTNDHLHAVEAFLAKGKPTFSGS